MPVPAVGSASRTKSLAAALGCGITVVLASLLTHPWVDAPLIDDFSYIWSARVLADTGHITYNGWGAMMLGWQLYLGAAFIKLFGFSFNAVHGSMLLVAFANAVLLQRIFVRLQLSERNAAFATLVLCLSPLYLVFVCSFMSDLPGIFAILICLYGCLRALSAERDRNALLWLAFAAISNDVTGTVRQIAWLGVLVMVPSAVWMMRKRRGVVATGVALWIASAVFVALCLHWFLTQPYTIHEKLFLGFSGWRMVVQMQVYTVLTFLLYCLPVTAGFLLPQTRDKNRWNVLAWISAISALVCVPLVAGHRDLLAPFSPGWVSVKGLTVYVPGDKPDLFSLPVRVVLTWLTFAATLAFLRTLILWLRQDRGTVVPLWRRFPTATLLGPFALAYAVLSFTRRPIFDRYLLVLLIVFLAMALRLYQERYGFGMNWTNVVAAIAFTAFSVASAHDWMSASRAALQATERLQSQGVPRSEFHASGEYDGWTELELNGYLDDPYIVLPLNAYKPWAPPPIDPQCLTSFTHLTADIHARYGLYTEPINCLSADDAKTMSAAPVGTVAYDAWLPPRRRQIYILPMSPR